MALPLASSSAFLCCQVPCVWQCCEKTVEVYMLLNVQKKTLPTLPTTCSMLSSSALVKFMSQVGKELCMCP